MVAIFDMVFIKLAGGSACGIAQHDNIALLLVNVVYGLTITVVIEINFHQGLRLLAKPLKHAKNYGFLLQRRSFHFDDRNEDLMEEDFDLFLQGVISGESNANTSESTFSLVLIPVNILQNISTLISKTCGTGLNAFRLRARQRYCFVALMNVVASFEEEE